MTQKGFLLRSLAEEDLASIYRYSLQEFGEDRAIQYIRELNNTFITLGENPEIARKCDFIKPGLLTYRVASHILFFRIIGTRISIIRILHKSMDYQRHL